jgi:hypothetical protein
VCFPQRDIIPIIDFLTLAFATNAQFDDFSSFIGRDR